MKNPKWQCRYARFVGGDIYGNDNPLKKKINQAFARRIKAGVGAQVLVGENGKPVRKSIDNEIIQSYTLFEDYDPQAVNPGHI